jgi:hypothetical protein
VSACGRCGRGWHWRRRYLKPTTASRVKEVRYINQQRDPYAQTLSGPPLPRDWAHPCHICICDLARPATSVLGLGSPLPHLHRDWARPSQLGSWTVLTLPHLHQRLGPPLPHLQRDLYIRQCPVLCGCKSPALLRLGAHSLAAANFRYNRTPAPETVGVLGFGTSTPRTADYVTPTPGVGARPE